MSGLLIPVAAAASLSVAQRLRISRRRIRAAEAKSTIAEKAEKDATAAREQAEEFVSGAVRQTSELEEQNRNLASVNAVSFALSGSMDEDGATETALQLIARVLEVPAVQLHELRSEGLQPRHVFVTAEPETGGERLDEALMEQAMQSSEPIVAGDVAAPLQPYAIIALIAKGRRVGSLAAIGTREAGWDERALRMFELIGRELGVALENECLYRDAVDGAEAETMVSTASRVVAVGEIDRALAQLLAMLAPVLDARVSGVVNRESGESTPRVIARYGESGSPALNAAFSAALESAPALAADRTTALVLGTGGEGPLPDALQEAAVGALAIVPVAVVSSDEAMAGGEPGSVRTVSAVLVIAGDSDAEWGERSLGIMRRLAEIIARRLETDAFTQLQERRMQEFAGLAKVASTIQSTIDPDRLYSGFAMAVRDLVPYGHLYIARVDVHDGLAQVSSFDSDGNLMPARESDPADGEHAWLAQRSIEQWAAEDGVPSFIEDDDRFGLVAPMRPKGQLLGLVAIGTRDPSLGQAKTLLAQATEHLSLALDSAALYRQATERAARIQVFGNLASTVASVVDLRDAFEEFAEEMRWVVPFDSALMIDVDEETGELHEYASCPRRQRRRSTGALVTGTPLEHAVRVGETITMMRSDPLFSDLNWGVLGVEAQSVAAVPMIHNGKLHAVFTIVRNDEQAFEVDELAALEEVTGLLSVSIDRLRLYERAEYNARHDTLTGLPNQRYLQERLESLRSGVTEDGESAIMMLDLDQFKVFNDTLGHEAGDRVLQLVTRELKASTRGEDFVARNGGDEFVVVMEDSGERAAQALANRIHETLVDLHTEIPGAPVKIRTSIGIAVAPNDGRTVEDVLRAADGAMYEAKSEEDRQHTRLARESRQDERARKLHVREGRTSTDAILNASRAGGSDEELDALATAERYALVAAVRLDAHPEATVPLRLLIAGLAAGRFDDLERRRVREGAQMMIDGHNETWRRTAPDVMALNEQIAHAAVELAWTEAAPPVGEGLDLATAAVRAREILAGSVEDDVLDAVDLAARERMLNSRSDRLAA